MNNKNICTIYLVRHGQSHGNHPIDTYGLDKELTEKGHQQARDAAKNLKKIKFDAIFASPLIRAQQTAKIIAEEHKLAVLTKEALKERHHGVLEGRIVKEAKEEIKDLIDTMYNMPYDKWKKVTLAQGRETDEEVMSRFITALREIAIAYAGKTVLTISHTSIMRTFLVHLGFKTYKELSDYTITNTAFVKLKTDGIDFFIEETQGIEPKEHPYQ
ncbi:MAG TPA: histidine phosphatase family protein [Candidatus Saccharimonadales bacterium]|nr:histidine phosphatase family protein [Candidatus Saccharimonadales bacterium]